MTDTPRYMSLETLAEALDVGTSTIEGWVVQGKFPAPKRVGPNGMRRWSWAEVQRTIEGPVAIETTDLIGRITNATRQASLSKNNGGSVCQRDKGLSSVPKI